VAIVAIATIFEHYECVDFQQNPILDEILIFTNRLFPENVEHGFVMN